MLPQTNSASSRRRRFAVTLSNSGDILFSSVSDTPSRRSACPSISDTSFFCDPRTSSGDETVRGSLLSLSNSLIDPNIELPNFSANEVEEVLNQFSAPARNRVDPQHPSQFFSEQVCRKPTTAHRHAGNGSTKTPRKGAVGLSKDDSFTPPPVKRSFALIPREQPSLTSTKLQKPLNCPAQSSLGRHQQNSELVVENTLSVTRERASGSSPLLLLQFKSAERTYPSRLISALQLPVVGASKTVKTTDSPATSSAPAQGGPTLLRRDKPSLSAASEHKLPKTFVTLVNATKQRQENLTVRLANRAKLITSQHLQCNSNQSVPTVAQNVQVQEPDPATPLIPVNKQFSSDYSSQSSGDRFRFLCPHPRCGRRYQARLGLTRHLVKYHGENIEESMPDSDLVYNRCQIDGADVISASAAALQVSTPPAAHTSLKLCLPIRAIRVERPSLSLDRSRQRSSSPSPSNTPKAITSFPGNSLSLVSLCPSVGASSLTRNMSPPFLTQRSCGGDGQPSFMTSSSSTVTAVGGGEKVAVIPLQLSSSATAAIVSASGAVATGNKFVQPSAAETVGLTAPPSTTTTTSVLRSMYSRHGSTVQATTAFSPPNDSPAGRNSARASFVGSSPMPMSPHEEDFRSVVLSVGSDWGSVMASDEVNSLPHAHRGPTDSLPCLRDIYAGDDDLAADAYSVSPPRSASMLSRFSAVSPSRSCTDCSSGHFPSPLVRTASSGSVLDLLTAFGDSSAATCGHNQHHRDHHRQHAASEFGDQFDDRRSWTDSAFSSSLGGHHSECYASDEADHSFCWHCRRQPPSPGSWQCPENSFAPHPRGGPPLSIVRQRKQRLSVISTDALGPVLSPSSHCCSSAGGGSYFSRRRRTVSSGIPASMDTTRSASVVREKTNYPAAPHASDAAAAAYCCCRLGRASAGTCGIGGNANAACCRQHFRSRTLDSESNSERVNEKASTGRSSAADLVACPVNDCGLVCAGCESLCEHLKECHLPDSQKKPVRLIFACPVKDCGIFCADEAAFEAHFDAHLDDQPDQLIKGLFRPRKGVQKENRQSQSHTAPVTTSDSQFRDAFFTDTPIPRPSSRKSADTSPQRLLTPRSSLPPNCSLFTDAGVKGDDMLEFMSPSATEGPSLPAVTSDVIDSADATPFDSAHTSPTEGTSPMSISDADGRSLLQALDLLPDDLLDELLQEDRAPLFGSSGGCGSGLEFRAGDVNLRKFSNSSVELAQPVSEKTSTELPDTGIVCSSSTGTSIGIMPVTVPRNSSAQSFATCCDLHSLTDPYLDNEGNRETLWCPCSNSQLPDLASALILPDAERRLRDTFLHTLSSPVDGGGDVIPCRQPTSPDVGRSRPLTPDLQMRTRGGKRQHSCLICPQRRQQGSGQLAVSAQPTPNGVGNQLSSVVSCPSAPPSAGPLDNHPVTSRSNAPGSASQLLFPKLSSRLSTVVPEREGPSGDTPLSYQFGNSDLFRRTATEHSLFWLAESGTEKHEEGKEGEGILGDCSQRLFGLRHCDCFACPCPRTPAVVASAHLSDTDMPLISSLATTGSTELSASRDALWAHHQPQQRSVNRLLKRRRTFFRRPNAGATPHSGRGGSSINPLSPRPYFRP
ncbi:hypothetical protein AAHC03_01077 [Spirometra sp. Aus1]